MEETLYFAYGSNINLEQMEHRCPDAQLVGPVTLQNYELQFRGQRLCHCLSQERQRRPRSAMEAHTEV